MPGTLSYKSVAKTRVVTLEQDLTSASSTDAVELSDSLVVQITGAATSVTFVVERSTKNPALFTPNWAPAKDPISGNPSTGMIPEGFYEPGVAWWRVRITAMTGTTVKVCIAGKTIG